MSFCTVPRTGLLFCSISQILNQCSLEPIQRFKWLPFSHGIVVLSHTVLWSWSQKPHILPFLSSPEFFDFVRQVETMWSKRAFTPTLLVQLNKNQEPLPTWCSCLLSWNTVLKLSVDQLTLLRSSSQRCSWPLWSKLLVVVFGVNTIQLIITVITTRVVIRSTLHRVSSKVTADVVALIPALTGLLK